MEMAWSKRVQTLWGRKSITFFFGEDHKQAAFENVRVYVEMFLVEIRS